MAVGKASLKRAAKAAETEPKKEETKVAAEEKPEEPEKAAESAKNDRHIPFTKELPVYLL